MDKDGRQKPNPDAWREHASEYERGFIDGMQEQIKRSVDRAVNALADKREWVGLTDEEAMQIWDGIIKYAPGEVRVKDFARAIEAKLKERNHD
jgi:hypothetical protein